MNLKLTLISLLTVLISSKGVIAQSTAEQQKIISVEKIWDKAGHSAFTDIVYFDDTFYCVFRESATHKPTQNKDIIVNGTIRMISSKDGDNWTSVTHLYKKDTDLRDPKLSITPDNKLMLLMGTSHYEGTELKSTQGQVCFFDLETKKFSEPQNINIDKKIRTKTDWLWNVTWKDGVAYGVVYQVYKNNYNDLSSHLVKSTDGINYEYVSSFELTSGPSEADVKFLNDGRMVVVIRGTEGSIGVSSPPFKKWSWNTLSAKLGGPELLVLDDNTLICATREFKGARVYRTILAKVTLSGGFEEILTLPSGGDTSYAGMILKDGILYVSYYSSHEGQTSIYTANSENGAGKSSIYLAKVWGDRLK